MKSIFVIEYWLVSEAWYSQVIPAAGQLSARMTSKLQSGQSPAPVRLSALARDNEKRGSRSHLANIGIHVQAMILL